MPGRGGGELERAGNTTLPRRCGRGADAHGERVMSGVGGLGGGFGRRVATQDTLPVWSRTMQGGGKKPARPRAEGDTRVPTRRQAATAAGRG